MEERMSILSRAMVALAFVGISLASPALGARTTREEANALYLEGNQKYNRGDHQGALEKLLKAYSIYPSYKIGYNIAATMEAVKRIEEAAEWYERFINQADKKAPKEILKSARASLASLSAKLYRMELICSVVGAQVQAGGRVIGKTPLEHRIYLRPGPGQLKVTKDGYAPFSQQMEFKAGQQKDLHVHLSLSGALAPKPAPATALAPSVPAPLKTEPGFKADPGAVTARQDSADTTLQERRRSKTIWAYATLGTGVALALGAGVLYGVGVSQGSEAQDSYLLATNKKPVASDTELAQLEADKESARTMVLVGNVLIGAAAVALGVSIYQFVTRPGDPAERRALEDAPAFGVSLCSGGAAFTLGHRF